MNNLPKHFGRFSIALDKIGENPELIISKIMASVLILEVNVNYMTESLEYAAWSDKLFRRLDEGEVVPWYNIVLGKKDDEDLHFGVYAEEVGDESRSPIEFREWENEE